MQYASIAPFDCVLILTTTENLAHVLLRGVEITLSGTKLSAWAFRLRQNTFSSSFFCPLPSVSMFLLPFALFLFCTNGNQWWRRRIVFAVGDVCPTWSESTTPYLCFSISCIQCISNFYFQCLCFFCISMFQFFCILISTRFLYFYLASLITPYLNLWRQSVLCQSWGVPLLSDQKHTFYHESSRPKSRRTAVAQFS